MTAPATTESYCPQCGGAIPAQILERDGQVFLRKMCPAHGQSEARISSSTTWYRRMMELDSIPKPPGGERKPSLAGCPKDCGYCAGHQQRMAMPVVPVTSACNLDCPVCYTINRNMDPFHMSREEFEEILRAMAGRDPEKHVINFTGGEPLAHPDFLALARMCSESGIKKITVSTNGIKLLQDEGLLAGLTDLGVSIVLSFNSFRKEPYRWSAGADLLEKKLAILERLARYKPSTTLLTVVARGVNDAEIGDIVSHVLASDFIVSSEIHPVTYTGQSVGRLPEEARITAPEIIGRIAEKNPAIREESFLPSPLAHPLCYSICYLLKLEDGAVAPYADFMEIETMRGLLSKSLYLTPSLEAEEALLGAINRLWAADNGGENEKILSALRGQARRMAKARGGGGKTAEVERMNKAIYIHSHMDMANFDTNRAKRCCVCVPQPDGGMIPICSYNNIYRAENPRFSARGR